MSVTLELIISYLAYILGDYGYYDETGHIFVVDRLKDVIKYDDIQV